MSDYSNLFGSKGMPIIWGGGMPTRNDNDIPARSGWI